MGDIQGNKSELDQLNQHFRDIALDDSDLLKELDELTAESEEKDKLLQ